MIQPWRWAADVADVTEHLRPALWPFHGGIVSAYVQARAAGQCAFAAIWSAQNGDLPCVAGSRAFLWIVEVERRCDAVVAALRARGANILGGAA